MSITFPGHGSPGKNCGEHWTVKNTWGCWSCGEYFEIESSCMKKTCPTCYQKWATREGWSAAERVTAFLRSPFYLRTLERIEHERYQGALTDPDATVEERRLYRIQSYHIVVTFEDTELRDRDDIRKHRQAARRIARRHGIFGEATVPHQRTEDDPGVHFHFLGVAGFIAPGRGDGSDYIIKVIPFEGRWHQRSLLDRHNIIRYACTHAAITDDSDCVTWSGCLATSKFPGALVVDQFGPKGQPQCPHCGSRETFQVRPPPWSPCDEDVWTGPDRPPPSEIQRCVSEFT